MGQKYYDFTHIFGEEMESLLITLKSLITTQKITGNLPDDTKGEISNINDKIDNLSADIEDCIDGGDYEEQIIELPGFGENDWEW